MENYKWLMQSNNSNYEQKEKVENKHSSFGIIKTATTNLYAKKKVNPEEEIDRMIRSMLNPAFDKKFSFSYGFPTPSIPIFIQNSINLKTNSLGTAWFSINFGQFLAASSFINTDGSVSTSVRSSNIFTSKETVSVGVNQIGSGLPIDHQAVNALSVNMEGNASSLYSAVKPGPALVRYDFMGNLNVSQGIVSAGIDYTAISTPGANVGVKGSLAPDLRRVTSKIIEDCPFNLTTSVTSSIEASYLPQELTTLKMVSPLASNDDITQRFFLLITGAEPNTTVARIKISQAWEGKPSPEYADLHSTTLLTSNDPGLMNEAITTIFENGLVLRVVSDGEFGLGKYTKYVD